MCWNLAHCRHERVKKDHLERKCPWNALFIHTFPFRKYWSCMQTANLNNMFGINLLSSQIMSFKWKQITRDAWGKWIILVLFLLRDDSESRILGCFTLTQQQGQQGRRMTTIGSDCKESESKWGYICDSSFPSMP
jgi:hypothetical protein